MSISPGGEARTRRQPAISNRPRPAEGCFGACGRASRRAARRCEAELGASLFDQLDDETWERLEEALILADVGARTTADVVGRLEAEVDGGGVSGADAMRDRLVELLAEVAGARRRPGRPAGRPAVVMVVGVNGTGKTTTIGKLAWHLERTSSACR